MFHDQSAPHPSRWASCALLAAGLAIGGTAGAGAADLSVEIAGVNSSEGEIYVAIHGSEYAETFPAEAGALYKLQLPAQAGTVRFAVFDVPAGRYAIAAFHDGDGDGELDANMLGMPTEGYGFSNDPVSVLGPPEFDAASLDLGSEAATVRFSLAY